VIEIASVLELARHVPVAAVAAVNAAVVQPPGTHFEVVFDVVREGYKSWSNGIGIFIPLALTLALVLAPDWVPAGTFWTKQRKQLFGVVGLLFNSFILVMDYAATYSDYTTLYTRVSRGECDISEGYVEHFNPMPPGGHSNESFDVAGSHFEYSEFSTTAGFNHSTSQGGPMREGLYARICHVGNEIGRLEIWR
jgi:hypothetical protein